MANTQLSFKDRVKDIFEKNEKGRHKPEWHFLMSTIFGLLSFIYIGLVFGFISGEHPRYSLFEIFYYMEPHDINIFAKLGTEVNPIYIYVMLVLFLFFDSYAFIRMDRFRRKSDNSKGHAKWNDVRLYNPQFVYPKGSSVPSEPDEYEDNEPGNMILAKDIYFNIKPNTMVYCNAVIVGTTGTGKTFGYVKPNILQFNCSYVLTDPSGELVHDTGKALMDHGYAVKVFNTAEMQYSARYNPFRYIRTDQDIKTMVKVFMQNTDDSEASKGDQFFTKAEEVFYLAICYYIRAYGKDHPDEIDMNFNTVFSMFLEAQASEENEGLISPFDQRFIDFANEPEEARDADGNIIYEEDANGNPVYKKNADGTLKLNKYGEPIPKPKPAIMTDRQGNVILENGKPKIKKKYANSPALKYYKIYKQGSGKTLKSILISAGVRLGFLAIDEVSQLLSGDDLELETMGDRKQALFAIIKAEDSTYNFISAMMFTQLFESLYYEAGQRNVCSWLLTKGKCTALKSKRWRNSNEKERVKQELIEEQNRYKDGAFIVGEEDEDPDRFTIEDENGILPWPKWKIVTKDYEWDPDTKTIISGSILKTFNGKKEAEVFLDTVLHGEIKQGTKVLTCHVRFILDEFANIGIIPEYDKKLATFRKYNISSDIILQSIDQLRKMYDDKIGLIISNCNIMILLGTTDKEDAEFFSELTGQKTVETVSKSLDMKGFTGVSGGSMSVDAENLMRPEDIRTMPSDECLVFVNTQQPFKAKKYWCPDHPNYHELYDDHNEAQMKNTFEYKRLFNTAQYEFNPSIITSEELIPKENPKQQKRRNLSQDNEKLMDQRKKLATLKEMRSGQNVAIVKDRSNTKVEPTPLKTRIVEQPPEVKAQIDNKFSKMSESEKQRMLDGIKEKGGTGSTKSLYLDENGDIFDAFGGFMCSGDM